MAYKIWNGKGEIQPGEACFHKMNGEVVGRPYARRRVVRAVNWLWSDPELRKEIIAKTVDNDEWLGPRNGYLVSALCREAQNAF